MNRKYVCRKLRNETLTTYSTYVENMATIPLYRSHFASTIRLTWYRKLIQHCHSPESITAHTDTDRRVVTTANICYKCNYTPITFRSREQPKAHPNWCNREPKQGTHCAANANGGGCRQGIDSCVSTSPRRLPRPSQR